MTLLGQARVSDISIRTVTGIYPLKGCKKRMTASATMCWRPAKYGLIVDGFNRDKAGISRGAGLDAMERLQTSASENLPMLQVHLLSVRVHYESLVSIESQLPEDTVPKSSKMLDLLGNLGLFLSNIILASNTGKALWRDARTEGSSVRKQTVFAMPDFFDYCLRKDQHPAGAGRVLVDVSAKKAVTILVEKEGYVLGVSCESGEVNCWAKSGWVRHQPDSRK
eukprot:6202757-Pleurochrysis_carterae.AAC.5